MENKHAFLIGAYKNASYLENLINQLTSDRSNIYIHINNRNWDEFAYLQEKYPYVKFVHNITVNWGGSSFLASIMSLLDIAIKDNQNEYYHLLTGQDILIKPLDDLFSFFDNNKKSYLSFWEANNNDINHRFNTYHLYDIFNINYGKHDIKFILESVIKRFQSVVRIREIKFPFSKVYRGSAWWSIHHNAMLYCYNYIVEKELLKLFKHTFAPDETVFQSIILDSKEEYPVENNSLRYIVWDRMYLGAQKLLKIEDFEGLVASNSFFARKVDSGNEDSAALIKRLTEYTRMR